jgi:hypothetical protein
MACLVQSQGQTAPRPGRVILHAIGDYMLHQGCYSTGLVVAQAG